MTGLDEGRNLPMYQYCAELKSKVTNNRDLDFFPPCRVSEGLASLDLRFLEGLEVC